MTLRGKIIIKYPVSMLDFNEKKNPIWNVFYHFILQKRDTVVELLSDSVIERKLAWRT